MPIFKRKEKNLIPEVTPVARAGSPAGQPTGSGSSRSSGKKEQPDPEGFEKLPGRRYQRDQYNYQPPSRPQQPGGYGNYGNYGQPQQQQPPPIEGQGSLSGAEGYQQQQQQGYGGYQNGGNPDARSALFRGARAPAATTGASFDSYSAGGRGGSLSGTGRSAPEAGYGGDDNDGEGVLSGKQETEEDDEV